MIDDFIKRWQFTRSETLNILAALDDDQLAYKPDGEEWQPLYYQFACMARTQLVYTKAAETGVMDFSLFASPDMPSKHDYRTKALLQDFLGKTNRQWLKILKKGMTEVTWGNEQKSLAIHVMSLAEHERIHHGQIISYFTLAGYGLPRSFKFNWAL